MGDFYTGSKDSLTHSMIVHELLKKIVVELGTKEFKGGYKKAIISGGVTYMDYVADSRAEYSQAIEALADILIPQYDDTMDKDWKTYDEGVKKLEKDIDGKDIRMGDEEHFKFTKAKLKLSKKLFRDLNLLLKRTNYLKAAAYTEDDIFDDEDEDDKKDEKEEGYVE